MPKNGPEFEAMPEAEVVQMPVMPVDDGNREFPVALSAFLDTIKNTEHEVWSHWLRQRHGSEAHTLREWHKVLDSHRHKPAHPSVL